MTAEIEEYFKSRPIKSWWKLTDNILVQKYMHPMYASWLKIRNVDPENGLLNTPLMGKWHYIYRSPKGRISLVELADEFHKDYPWETCGSLEPDNYERRFATRDEAEARIKELLD